MSFKNLSVFLAVVASGCAMKMNGKSVGFGGSSASADPTSSGGSDTPSAPEHTQRVNGFDDPEPDTSGGDPQKQGFYKDYPRYPDAPVDPWKAVKDGFPIVTRADDWEVRASDGSDCTAAHDHCIDYRTWFFEHDDDRDDKQHQGRRQATLATFTEEGIFGPSNTRATGAIFGDDNNKYSAYKTVPATKKNLAKGTLVVAMAYPTTTPGNGEDVFDNIYWHIGVVDHVDWDLNKVYLVGAEDESLAIAGTRVCALIYRKGEKVKLVGGLTKDQIEVKASEVILPDAPVD
jgi:hypothetical protein